MKGRVALDKSEGVVKRHFLSAMPFSTASLPERGTMDFTAKVLLSSTLPRIPFLQLPSRAILAFKITNG
jgi:hypothetical protein